jgi:hypothetical protein
MKKPPQKSKKSIHHRAHREHRGKYGKRQPEGEIRSPRKIQPFWPSPIAETLQNQIVQLTDAAVSLSLGGSSPAFRFIFEP